MRTATRTTRTYGKKEAILGLFVIFTGIIILLNFIFLLKFSFFYTYKNDKSIKELIEQVKIINSNVSSIKHSKDNLLNNNTNNLNNLNNFSLNRFEHITDNTYLQHTDIKGKSIELLTKDKHIVYFNPVYTYYIIKKENNIDYNNFETSILNPIIINKLGYIVDKYDLKYLLSHQGLIKFVKEVQQEIGKEFKDISIDLIDLSVQLQ